MKYECVQKPHQDVSGDFFKKGGRGDLSVKWCGGPEFGCCGGE